MVLDRIGRVAMGDLPVMFATRQVDGGDGAVGRLEDGQPVDGVLARAETILAADALRIVGARSRAGIAHGGGGKRCHPRHAAHIFIFREFRIALHHAHHVGGVLGEDVNAVRFRVVAAPRPVGAALEARRQQRAPGAVRRGKAGRFKRPAGLVALDQRQAARVQLRREVQNRVGIDVLHAVRRGPGRDRLGGRVPFAWHAARRHRQVGDRPDRLAGFAIQHIQPVLLAGLGQRLDDFSIVRDVAQDRGTGDVAVPQAVTYHLIVPFALAGIDVDRDDAFAEQAVADAVDANRVAGRHLDRQIGEAQLFVGAGLRPHAGIARRFGLAGLQPAFVAHLALARHGVENPFALAGARVIAADITLDAALLGRNAAAQEGRAHDHCVVGHQRGGVQPDGFFFQVHLLVVVGLQIDHAIDSEACHAVAGLGVQRDQAVTGSDIENALGFAVGPIGHAMAGILPGRIAAARAFILAVHPQHLAGGRVQAHHRAAGAGGDIHAALDDQGRAFILVFGPRPQIVGLEAPGDLQLAEILAVDLVQRRIAGVGRVGGIVAPFGIGGRLRQGGQLRGGKHGGARQEHVAA